MKLPPVIITKCCKMLKTKHSCYKNKPIQSNLLYFSCFGCNSLSSPFVEVICNGSGFICRSQRFICLTLYHWHFFLCSIQSILSLLNNMAHNDPYNHWFVTHCNIHSYIYKMIAWILYTFVLLIFRLYFFSRINQCVIQKNEISCMLKIFRVFKSFV